MMMHSVLKPKLVSLDPTKTVLWSDFKRNAAVITSWPLHKISALEELKADCLRKGI